MRLHCPVCAKPITAENCQDTWPTDTVTMSTWLALSLGASTPPPGKVLSRDTSRSASVPVSAASSVWPSGRTSFHTRRLSRSVMSVCYVMKGSTLKLRWILSVLCMKPKYMLYLLIIGVTWRGFHFVFFRIIYLANKHLLNSVID